MENERRSAQRFRVDLPVRWEGFLSNENAAITDLSHSGCFVLTAGMVEEREWIWLEIQLPGQLPVYFWAEVTDRAPEIGFAVRFTSSSEEDKQRLAGYINDLMPGAK